jgi:hypothetical protein
MRWLRFSDSSKVVATLPMGSWPRIASTRLELDMILPSYCGKLLRAKSSHLHL